MRPPKVGKSMLLLRCLQSYKQTSFCKSWYPGVARPLLVLFLTRATCSSSRSLGMNMCVTKPQTCARRAVPHLKYLAELNTYAEHLVLGCPRPSPPSIYVSLLQRLHLSPIVHETPSPSRILPNQSSCKFNMKIMPCLCSFQVLICEQVLPVEITPQRVYKLGPRGGL
jgi:hypothetical protein